jgi:hypothetical protein
MDHDSKEEGILDPDTTSAKTVVLCIHLFYGLHIQSFTQPIITRTWNSVSFSFISRCKARSDQKANISSYSIYFVFICNLVMWLLKIKSS